jgi:hypothetical protein
MLFGNARGFSCSQNATPVHGIGHTLLDAVYRGTMVWHKVPDHETSLGDFVVEYRGRQMYRSLFWNTIETAGRVAGSAGQLETAGNNIYIINQDPGDILVDIINPE